MRGLTGFLVAVAALVAVAGCGGSVSNAGSAAGTGAASIAPANAVAYVGVVTDDGSEQWQALQTLLDRFPDGDKLLQGIADDLSDEGLDWQRDIRPALGPETAIVVLPGRNNAVVLTKPTLRAKLEALLNRTADSATTRSLDDGWVAAAETAATLDAFQAAVKQGTLADEDVFTEAVDRLPEGSVATVFVRPGVVAAATSSSTEMLGPLGVGLNRDLGFEWASAAVVPADDGLGVEGYAKLVEDPPASYEPKLLERVPADAVAVMSFHGGDKSVVSQLETGPLAPFLPSVQQSLGVSIGQILQLIDGENLIYVRPGLPIPEVTLALDVDDTTAATATVDTIVRRLGAPIENVTSGGLPAHAVRVQQVRITWGAADGIFVVSTAADALRPATGAKLVDAPSFQDAADKVQLGDTTSGFFYADMDQLMQLIEGIATLASEDVPPEVKRNVDPLDSLAFNGGADGNVVTLHGFLSVPAR